MLHGILSKKYYTYTCHTLRVQSPPKVLLRPLSRIFLQIPKQYFVFVFCPKKTKPTQSAAIVLTLWIYRTEDKLQSCILVWRDSKKRCVHCNWPIARMFGRHSCVARATAICILHIVEVIQRSRRNNK